MKEINKKTLLDGLNRLPVYEAPAPVWDKISDQLSSDRVFRETLQQLPVYEAPRDSWLHIERRLRRPLKLKLYIQVAAASAALLLTLGILLRQGQPAQRITLSYTTEHMQIPDSADPDLQEDEALMQGLMVAFDQTGFLADYPEIGQLRAEYVELKEAHELLRELIDQYGADPSLEFQLKNIEFQRSDLVKELSTRLVYFN